MPQVETWNAQPKSFNLALLPTSNLNPYLLSDKVRDTQAVEYNKHVSLLTQIMCSNNILHIQESKNKA